MKVEIIDEDKIVLYLYNYFFQVNEKEIVSEIKKIFLRLIKYYQIHIGGVYNVSLYENQNYGTILEIEKTSELLFNPDLIDIKVKIYKDVSFYFKTSDYFVLKDYKDVYYENNYYYVSLDSIKDLIKILEFGKIGYCKDTSFKSKKIFIN